MIKAVVLGAITGIVVGSFAALMYHAGHLAGKKQGYAVCVSEEDDDSVRVRRF